jgi:hypothetical protein
MYDFGYNKTFGYFCYQTNLSHKKNINNEYFLIVSLSVDNNKT